MSGKKVVLLLLSLALLLGLGIALMGVFLLKPLPLDLEALRDRTPPPRESPLGLELHPKGPPKALLAFYPGARVEPLAYLPTLGPVAEGGYLVVLLRVPVGIALLDKEKALRAREAYPGLPLALGGHSLGGVVAAELAAREGLPLVLFASYPEGDLSGLSLPTLALYGTEDGLLPPEEARAKATRLPQGARVVFIPGLNHAGFGAYGPQAGDRPPKAPKEALWERVAGEVLGFLEGVF